MRLCAVRPCSRSGNVKDVEILMLRHKIAVPQRPPRTETSAEHWTGDTAANSGPRPHLEPEPSAGGSARSTGGPDAGTAARTAGLLSKTAAVRAGGLPRACARHIGPL